jgi:hypothetical protein
MNPFYLRGGQVSMQKKLTALLMIAGGLSGEDRGATIQGKPDGKRS